MAQMVMDWRRPHDGPIDHFQVFGERRTGTNYLARLIAGNLPLDETTRYGWKHGAPTMPCIARAGLIVVVLREPFAWLESLHNRPFAKSHEGLAFSEFLRTEWYDQYRPKDFGHARWGYDGMRRDVRVANQIDRHPITGRRFRNPLEMRSVKTACFLGFLERESNVAIVDYDVASRRPADLLAELARLFGLPAPDEARVPGRVGAAGKPAARIGKAELPPEDLDFIAANLDLEQERRLGYGDSFDFMQPVGRGA